MEPNAEPPSVAAEPREDDARPRVSGEWVTVEREAESDAVEAGDAA